MAGCRTRVTVGKVEHGKLLFAVTSYFHNDNVYLFRITPSLFPKRVFFSNPSVSLSKGSSTFSPSPSSSGSGDVTALRCSEPLRYKDGGASKPSPDCAGWDRLGVVQKELKELGLWKFAGAVMYIMQEVFGMPASRLIVPPNEKYGKFVLNEVQEAGNFGKHDERNRFGKSKLGHNLQRVYRDMRLVRYFPAEAMSEPFFRVWHFFWRLKHRR